MAVSETIWLLSAADDNYARPLAVLIFSLLSRLDPAIEVRYTVVNDGICKSKVRKIEAMVKKIRPSAHLQWVDASTLPVEGLVGSAHISRASYLRLFLGSFMPPDCHRLLYLDADVVVLADVAQLWRTDLDGRTVGAVRDMMIADVADPIAQIDWQESGLDSSSICFNSGVLLVDLDRWRSDNQETTLIAFARRHVGVGWCDQNALNVVYANAWKPLELMWNVQGVLLYLEREVSTPWREEMKTARSDLFRQVRIGHFSADIKPWQSKCRSPLGPVWWRELRLSGWHSALDYRFVRVAMIWRKQQSRLRVARGREEAVHYVL